MSPPPPASPLSGQGTAPSHNAHHSISGISAAKASLARATHTPNSSTSSLTGALGRRPTLNGSPKAASEELERERAKTASLKALVSAAEEREADAVKDCAAWRTKADQLAVELGRMELELAQAQEQKSELERVSKELDKARALIKEHEHRQSQQADEFEASRSAWVDEEAILRARLATANAKISELEKQTVVKDAEPESSPAAVVVPSEPRVDPDTSGLSAALEAVAEEKSAAEAELERALAAAETLKAQLADLERVNEQLMDDNESYQLLVGERTLMGGFDLKQLLRGDDDEIGVKASVRRSTPSTSSAPSLAGVEEEEEGDEDEESDEVERAVLESHGNGSRTTGAVDAEVSRDSKAKRLPKRGKEGGGAGLDLAAELAQAEETEAEQSQRKKDVEERKHSRKIAKEKDQEIKTLQDANKALVLYISKILDRISAHEGFEKVLSSEYVADPNSPARNRVRPPLNTATSTNKSGLSTASKPSGAGELKPLNLPVANSGGLPSAPTAKRGSWLDFFTGAKSPSAASAAAGIKPLRLGTAGAVTGGSGASVGLSAGCTGVKEQPDLEAAEEEASEEARAREREIAEMKLHGLGKVSAGGGSEALGESERTIRANRRSSSMYGPTSSAVLAKTSVEERRRTSGDPAGHILSSAAQLSVSPPMTPAGIMKRGEEREKESKKNLEKGQASGFTEIEIRGHRMRPSVARQSTGSAGSVSPILQQAGGPGGAGLIGKVTSPGIRDLKMSSDLNGDAQQQQQTQANEGLLARTARRISMMGGGK